MVYRLDVPTAAPSPPPLGTIGTEGYPTSGSPGVSPPATIDPYWAYSITEEIRNVVVKSGAAPQKALVNQMMTAIAAMYSPAPLYIDATQSITVPLFATKMAFKLWAGGGSGGVSNSATSRGGGGGEGGYIEGVQFADVVPGGTMTITIGAGGAAVSAGSGNPGSTSTIGAGATATPGQGGGGGTAVYSGGVAGAGAINSTLVNALVAGGQDGGDGDANANLPGGNGGGRGGRGGTAGGLNGNGPGGGGGGCPSGYTGGAGANGFAIITFYP